ncbi:MAG TPA: hypothetical protein PKI93_08650 [Alphaproteobacteria bacterium]|nr:hypothetical protein [Alphaproteobacteria bacterium]HNS45510.1 hypothetical protein [Alphaproteobacteria bacterium]
MMRLLTILVLFCAVCFAGCSKGEDGPIKAYEAATLEAGKGLGDIVLGMKLKAFVDKFGTGKVAYLAGDGEAIELNFAGEEVSFLFPIVGECWKKMPQAAWRVHAKHDLMKWMEITPDCESIGLSSISVKEGGFYKGQTDKGVKMGDTAMTSYQHGRMYDPRPQQQMLAGMSPQNPDMWLEYMDGIMFYYTASSPNDLESTQIRRMTIFKVD